MRRYALDKTNWTTVKLDGKVSVEMEGGVPVVDVRGLVLEKEEGEVLMPETVAVETNNPAEDALVSLKKTLMVIYSHRIHHKF
jgi:hypothetical protein